MALREVGHGYRGEIPHHIGAENLPSGGDRILLEMVEAEALSRITDLHIQKSLWTNVITRFGVPQEIVTYNGS